MRHLLLAMLAAVFTIGGFGWIHAPPTPDASVIAEYSVETTENLGDAGLVQRSNYLYSIDAIQQYQAVHYGDVQTYDDLFGAAPAVAHPTTGGLLTEPTTRPYLYPAYAECETAGRSAKPAASRHPLRC